MLHGVDTQPQREHLKQEDVYKRAYENRSGDHYDFCTSPAKLTQAGDTIKSAESEKIANLTILNSQESRLAKINSLVFQPLISILHKLEVEKEALARCEDFSMESVFLMFAQSTVDKVSKTDLISRLCSMGITCEALDVENLVARYDTDFDHKLSLWEFLNMFAPLRSNLRAAIENRPVQAMSNQTVQKVKSVLSKHIDTERMCAQIRAQVSSQMPRLRDVFDDLDWNQRGYLTGTEIRRHFAGHPDETQAYRGATTNAVELMIRRFNKDKFTGRVSLTEWLEELTP